MSAEKWKGDRVTKEVVTGNQSMENGQEAPIYVEHILLASVTNSIEGPIIQDFLPELAAAMDVPGVLAVHVGRCVSVLGDHTFCMHIRASDTASCDASYQAAHEAYVAHIIRHNLNTAEDFTNIVIVDFESIPIGSFNAQWPAMRICVLKFKEDAPYRKRLNMEEVAKTFPTRFPLVKQASWGRNIARDRMYRGNYAYADVDQHLGFVFAFDSVEDMNSLGVDPQYWELLNSYGIGILDSYHVYQFSPLVYSCSSPPQRTSLEHAMNSCSMNGNDFSFDDHVHDDNVNADSINGGSMNGGSTNGGTMSGGSMRGGSMNGGSMDCRTEMYGGPMYGSPIYGGYTNAYSNSGVEDGCAPTSCSEVYSKNDNPAENGDPLENGGDPVENGDPAENVDPVENGAPLDDDIGIML